MRQASGPPRGRSKIPGPWPRGESRHIFNRTESTNQSSDPFCPETFLRSSIRGRSGQRASLFRPHPQRAWEESGEATSGPAPKARAVKSPVRTPSPTPSSITTRQLPSSIQEDGRSVSCRALSSVVGYFFSLKFHIIILDVHIATVSAIAVCMLLLILV
ncbi:hypothetical protein AVEN_214268-1 [Araneus ventricosus]|uniref:Uncharacterized protein n=1 Tax=Araneus ventricosus TaxID=182803 RepID=A0A4Y2T7X9_ARAVE|nr:hypothetical protein AVEN_214268-1 [Araneus ventricosus]